MPMHLCRERLNRILRILDRHAGALPVREFFRSYSVWEWEVEQAAELGWIEIKTMKPRTGRPSRVVSKVSETQPRNYPPWRAQIEKPISFRHQDFALYSACLAIKNGGGWFGMLPYVGAYQKAFPAARSRAGAAASMSRLLRHPDVRAARQWFYAKGGREIPRAEPMPDTASGIWQRFREAGNHRAAYAPRVRITLRYV